MLWRTFIMMPATRLNNTPAALVLSVVKNYNDSSHLYLTGNTHTHTQTKKVADRYAHCKCWCSESQTTTGTAYFF